jgi:hypothetical protein
VSTLTAEQQEFRKHRTTASQFPTLMMGDDAAINTLWRQRVGEEAFPDLSDEWDVQRGVHDEQFILDWHQDKTLKLPLIDRGKQFVHPEFDHFGSTIDAYCVETDTVYEVKSTRTKPEWFLPFYTSQVLMQMLCRGASRGVLLVSQWAGAPQEYEIEFDDDYKNEMLERGHAFQLCVKALRPPCVLPPVVPPEKWRTINLDREQPNWASEMKEYIGCWAHSRDAATQHDEAAAAIRKLVPADCGRLVFGDFQVKRDKRGALRIGATS